MPKRTMLRSIAFLMPVLFAALVGCGPGATTASQSPPTEETPETPNVADILRTDERFGTLFRLVEEIPPILDHMESLAWNHTLFAPTDEAFEALPQGRLEAIAAEERNLVRLLDNHIYPEVLPSSAIEAGQLPMIGGDVRVRIRGDGIRFGHGTIIEADIEASNGIIHVLDAVITRSCRPIGTTSKLCLDLLEEP